MSWLASLVRAWALDDGCSLASGKAVINHMWLRDMLGASSSPGMISLSIPYPPGSYSACVVSTIFSSSASSTMTTHILFYCVFFLDSGSCIDDELCTDTRPALRDRRCIVSSGLCFSSFLFYWTRTWPSLRGSEPQTTCPLILFFIFYFFFPFSVPLLILIPPFAFYLSIKLELQDTQDKTASELMLYIIIQ